MLTVAVTGPTGEIGRAFVTALDRSREVGRIVGMARSPFSPAELGWRKVEYREGDILDRGAVEALVADADVVVHLAFVIIAGSRSREVNLTGSRNVFEATVAAGAGRLVYTSSVAAYGFSPELPALLTEDVEALGTGRHPYSAQKAEVEAELASTLAGSNMKAYVFRPCIVAGPEAPLLIESVPMSGAARHLPGAARALLGRVPLVRPVLPDPGVPFQLVHHEDVAAALVSAVVAEDAPPGVYNLAADGAVTITDLAHALGWHAIPAPPRAVDVTAELVARLPLMPDRATWVETLRRPVLMDSTRARRELGWRPRYDARQTLREMVAAFRE